MAPGMTPAVTARDVTYLSRKIYRMQHKQGQ